MGYQDILQRLKTSAFRSRFHLLQADKDYVKAKGLAVIEQHARDFIQKRLAPTQPLNDGKQTPMRGHPVFIAQHATATCCRGCLEKWHGIKRGQELTPDQIDFVVQLIMAFISSEI